MILVADAGGTKCHWAVVGGSTCGIISTSGINPVTMSTSQTSAVLRDELLPQLHDTQISEIYFYGAGCIYGAAATSELERTMHDVFPTAKIEIRSDMLGAARALCGRERGVACILGTGSNSALYDGVRIVSNVPPLGYILGDEGGGACIGRMVVADALKGLMPREIVEALYEECHTSYTDIIENVYRRPNANRFLASFVPFAARHIGKAEIARCVDRAFEAFAERNLLQYDGITSTPVHFTGGVAAAFGSRLRSVLGRYSIEVGRIEASPIDAMVKYHTVKG